MNNLYSKIERLLDITTGYSAQNNNFEEERKKLIREIKITKKIRIKNGNTRNI